MNAIECKRILAAIAKWERISYGVPYDSDLTPSGRMKWLMENVFNGKK